MQRFNWTLPLPYHPQKYHKAINREGPGRTKKEGSIELRGADLTDLGERMPSMSASESVGVDDISTIIDTIVDQGEPPSQELALTIRHCLWKRMLDSIECQASSFIPVTAAAAAADAAVAATAAAAAAHLPLPPPPPSISRRRRRRRRPLPAAAPPPLQTHPRRFMCAVVMTLLVIRCLD
jgi:hypothetical protein